MISTITSSGLLAALAILLSNSNLIVSTTALTENEEETYEIKNNDIQRHRQSRRVIPPPYYPSKIKTTEDLLAEEEEVEETLVNVFKVDINKDKVPGGAGGIFNNNNEEEEVKEEENVIVPYIVGGSDIVTPRKYPVSSFLYFIYCCNLLMIETTHDMCYILFYLHIFFASVERCLHLPASPLSLSPLQHFLYLFINKHYISTLYI